MTDYSGFNSSSSFEMPGRDLTSEMKSEILTLLHLKTMSVRKIARITGASKSTVARMRMLKTTKSRRRGRCGRKLSTTAKEDRILLRSLRRAPLNDAVQLRNEWKAAGVDVSLSTVQRRLRKFQCRSLVPRRVPQLTTNMKQKRLAFAKAHENWSVEQWRLVCFSDESIFECKGAQKRRVWHVKGTPLPIRQTVKHPTKIMIWGMISAKGPGRLHIVEGMMNSTEYKKVLESKAIPQLQEWFPDGECIFMHDGAPCHRSKVVNQYLTEKNVTVLDWPGNSPDMNPIENIWGVLKQRLACERITSKQELFSRILHFWFCDPTIPEIIVKVMESMPRRMKAVIDSKGGHTTFCTVSIIFFHLYP